MSFTFKTCVHLRHGRVQPWDADEYDGDEREVDVTVTAYYAPYIQARPNGDPDDCSPSEGGHIEIQDIHRDDTGGLVSPDMSELAEADLIETAANHMADEARRREE